MKNVGPHESAPKISVIINNFNYAGFLQRAIDSALEQDYQNFEVVVVDDGSTDSSRELIRAYEGRIVAVTQQNKGQAAAINAGVKASSGEILCFLDSDDWWLPQKLAMVAVAFDLNPRAALVFHRLQPIAGDDRQAGKPIPRSLAPTNLVPYIVRSAGWWDFPMTSAVAVRRSMWEAAGNIPCHFRISADAWLVGVYPFLGPVIALPDTVGFYRLHADNNWSRPVDGAVLRQRVEHFRATVASINEFLDENEHPYRLQIEKHLPLQIALAKINGAGLWKRLRLASATLTFAGSHDFRKRFRDFIHEIRTLRAPAGRGAALRGPLPPTCP